jgi:hypothetical protein
MLHPLYCHVYKLTIVYISDTAEYKLYEYINLEYNFIKKILILQRRGRSKPIPSTSSNFGTRTRAASPKLHYVAQGSLGRQSRGGTRNRHCKPTRKLHVQGLSRWSWPWFGRNTWFGRTKFGPNRPQTLLSGWQGGPWDLWCMVWCCPNSVACPSGPFDPC